MIVKRKYGFSSAVALSISDLGTGLIAGFSAQPPGVDVVPHATFTIPAGDADAAVYLKIKAADEVQLRNQEFTVTAHGGGLTREASSDRPRPRLELYVPNLRRVTMQDHQAQYPIQIVRLGLLLALCGQVLYRCNGRSILHSSGGDSTGAGRCSERRGNYIC